jgi:hypothetical protein
MAKRISGTVASLGPARVSRGEIKFKSIVIGTSDGQTLDWQDVSASRRVADLLHPGAKGVFYASKMWSSIYGFRPETGAAVFDHFGSNFLALLMCIGMIGAGFFTAVFVFGILIGFAGVFGFFLCLDARNARAKFNRDERAGRKALRTST